MPALVSGILGLSPILSQKNPHCTALFWYWTASGIISYLQGMEMNININLNMYMFIYV
jgi:hypothetical protein